MFSEMTRIYVINDGAGDNFVPPWDGFLYDEEVDQDGGVSYMVQE
jgi:hypothetical protein